MDYNNKFILNCKPLNDQSAMEPLEFLSFTQFISIQFSKILPKNVFTPLPVLFAFFHKGLYILSIKIKGVI